MAQGGRMGGQPRHKLNISYVIREPSEPDHRGGINSIRYDPYHERLYTAGRDAIIRGWDMTTVQKKKVVQMEEHTDWVNDFVVVDKGNFVVSGSSDSSIKIFSTSSGVCKMTLNHHQDYVRGLAFAEQADSLFSVGLDANIIKWDLGALVKIAQSSTLVECTPRMESYKKSMYSVACNPSASVLVSGGTENAIRVWDGRSFQKVCKLRGHQDNIRALLVNNDGSQCISGSSDGTVRLWSIGQQRCVATVRCHDSGVWTMLTDPNNFHDVYTSGRDGNVFMTDLRQPDTSEYILQQKSPINKIEMDDHQRLWVATCDSSVSLWEPSSASGEVCEGSSVANGASGSNGSASPGETPMLSSPSFVLTGAPAIVKFQLLANRTSVLTQDTEGVVALWDIFRGKKLSVLGEVDFEEAVKEKQGTGLIYVPNWCALNCSTGYLTITLDECESFCAWVYAHDCGVTGEEHDMKLNLGAMLLRAIFQNWSGAGSQIAPDTQSGSPLGEAGNKYFKLEQHLPLFLSETGDAGETKLRYTVGQLLKLSEGESSRLGECMPPWAFDIVVKGHLPRWNKVTFFLEPAESSALRQLKKDRLSAHDVVEVQKVLDHIHLFMFTADDAAMSRHPKFQSWGDSTPEAVLQVMLGDQPLDPKMDLRTARYFYWKSSSDMKIKYRLLEEDPQAQAQTAGSTGSQS